MSSIPPPRTDPSLLNNLPVESIGRALVALHRANSARDTFADSWIPAPLRGVAKDPIPDVGDTLYSIVRSQLDQLNVLLKLGQSEMSRVARAWPIPERPARLVVQLHGPSGQDITGNASFKNRFPRKVLPRIRYAPFITRDGLPAGTVVPSFSFEPPGEVDVCGMCTLTVSVPGSAFNSSKGWYFSDGRILVDGETLALLTIELQLL